MKKHLIVVVEFLVLGAIIGTIVLVAMNDEQSSDAGKSAIVDEPAGTKMAERGCLVYVDGLLEEVPEGSVKACSVEGVLGTCAMGRSVCVEGEWATCRPLFNPVVETCNGYDDDCDGLADEECEAECQSRKDCIPGFACRRGQCEEIKISLGCVPGHNEFDFDCDGIADDYDVCPKAVGFNQKSGCP